MSPPVPSDIKLDPYFFMKLTSSYPQVAVQHMILKLRILMMDIFGSQALK